VLSVVISLQLGGINFERISTKRLSVYVVQDHLNVRNRKARNLMCCSPLYSITYSNQS